MHKIILAALAAMTIAPAASAEDYRIACAAPFLEAVEGVLRATTTGTDAEFAEIMKDHTDRAINIAEQRSNMALNQPWAQLFFVRRDKSAACLMFGEIGPQVIYGAGQEEPADDYDEGHYEPER